MVEDRDLILQLTDSLTRRKAALRINPEDRVVNLGQLLDKYLWSCPTESLLQTGAIHLDSAHTLQAFKDLVYLSNDRGQLTGMFSGIVFKQQERPVGLEEYPITENARAG